MKKWFVCCVILLFLLSGCKEEPVDEMSPVQWAEEETTAPAIPDSIPPVIPMMGYADQISLFLDQREQWIRSDAENAYSYAVTDLDRNGRLEVLISLCMESGEASYTEIWELNESMDGLNYIYPVYDRVVSQVRFTVETASVFYQNGSYDYIFEASGRNTPERFGTEKRSFCLSQGTVREEALARSWTQPDGQGGAVTCWTDREDRVLTWEQYDRIEDTFYPYALKLEARFAWSHLKAEDISAMGRQDWENLLVNAWQNFAVE